MSGTTTTLRREAPLFEADVRVCQSPSGATSDALGETIPMTIRVIAGTRHLGGTQSQKLLHLEFTNPEDLAFLYTLQISEDDYPSLKQEQCLRIDFSDFADFFIDLLTQCANNPQYTACITANATPSSTPTRIRNMQHNHSYSHQEQQQGRGESRFQVIEATQFRNNTHLSLKIVAGNDDTVKNYLAARLGLAGSRIKLMTSELATARQETEALQERFDQQTADLTELRNTQDSRIQKLQQQHAEELTSVREAALNEAERQQREAAQRLLESQREAEAHGSNTVQELKAARKELKQVRAAKFEVELQNGRLTSEVESLRTDATHLRAKCTAETAAKEELTREKHASEKLLAEAQSKVIALNQQVVDKSETLKQVNALVEGLRSERNQCEESLRLFKDSNVRLQSQMDSSVSEINKGNVVIQRLQRDKKAYRAKIRLQENVLEQQEKRITDYEQRLDNDRQRFLALQGNVKSLGQTADEANLQRNELQQDLADAQKQLQENKKIIAYLHDELTRAKSRSLSGVGAGAAMDFDLAGGLNTTSVGGVGASSPYSSSFFSGVGGGLDPRLIIGSGGAGAGIGAGISAGMNAGNSKPSYTFSSSYGDSQPTKTAGLSMDSGMGVGDTYSTQPRYLRANPRKASSLSHNQSDNEGHNSSSSTTTIDHPGDTGTSMGARFALPTQHVANSEHEHASGEGSSSGHSSSYFGGINKDRAPSGPGATGTTDGTKGLHQQASREMGSFETHRPAEFASAF